MGRMIVPVKIIGHIFPTPIRLCPVKNNPINPEIRAPIPIDKTNGNSVLWRIITKLRAKNRAAPSPHKAPKSGHIPKSNSFWLAPKTAIEIPNNTANIVIQVDFKVTSPRIKCAKMAEKTGTVATPIKRMEAGAMETPTLNKVAVKTWETTMKMLHFVFKILKSFSREAFRVINHIRMKPIPDKRPLHAAI